MWFAVGENRHRDELKMEKWEKRRGGDCVEVAERTGVLNDAQAIN